MFNIGSFFEKFNNAAVQEMKKREIIAQAIEKSTGAKIDIKDISLNNKIVQVAGGPGLKNQIFMKKQSILADIQKGMPTFIIIDVR